MSTKRQSAVVGFSIDATVFLQPNQISRDSAPNAEWLRLRCPLRPDDTWGDISVGKDSLNDCLRAAS